MGEMEVADPVPTRPVDFADAVRAKQFTSPNTDKDIVVQLYEKIWPKISQKDTGLFGAGWGDDEVEKFMLALPEMHRLKHVTLHLSAASKASLKPLHEELQHRGGFLKVDSKRG